MLSLRVVHEVLYICTMKELAYLNKYFAQYKGRFLLGIVFIAISNYFRVWQPQIIRYSLDLVIENVTLYNLYDGFEVKDQLLERIGSILFFFMLLVISFAFLMGFFMFFMRQTLIVMSRLIEYDLRNDIYTHYEKLTLAFYKRNNTGDLMARITEDVNHVRMYLGPAVMYSINLVILFTMVIYSMVQVSPILTFYSLIPLPILSISIYYVTSIINTKSARIQAQLSVLNSLSQEVYSGIRVVKSYGQEKAMGDFFKTETEDFKSKSLELAKINAFFRPLMLFLIGVSTIITIYVGGILVMSGEVSAGNIAEFVIYINMLAWPVTSIGWVASIIQRAAASQKRINDFLKTEPDVLIDNKIPKTPIEGSIEFKDVSFVYPDTGIKALENISFKLEKGQKMAIIGRTGSGKTTLADLLLRMYDVSAGQILIDGIPIQGHNLAHLRETIAYVPQDVFLFSDSIYNNIAFGQTKADKSEIRAYAKHAAVYEDIMNLPEQFDTVIGERGVTLSGGQKQRVSIARALVKQPDILLLDDCLSAVDTKTEAKITGYLNTACADKTTVIITHRLYAALQFDKIIVLTDGKITEVGTHNELIQNKGYYYEMYENQRLEEIEPQ
ncbi:MAG: ABC transporter, transmembrane region:ABC transporter [uncultured Aureispira sp.]|uniref:ABC transporter, transmembrane region:ABC transporter n=1 Tax=uncultured Aureispira sp. TaxID=1331704 RepID=A0A6S6TK22_9BACT|nr:MAG: ABC transporter, transmembrane region:ABC transporter [uncultured Aureispira sp.]